MPRKLFKQDYTVEEVLEAIDKAIERLRSLTDIEEVQLIVEMAEWAIEDLASIAGYAELVSDPPTQDELSTIREALYEALEKINMYEGDEFLYDAFANYHPVTELLDWLIFEYPPLKVADRLLDYSGFDKWLVAFDESVLVAWEGQSVINDIAEELPSVIARLEGIIESGKASYSDIREIASELRRLAGYIGRVYEKYRPTVREIRETLIGFFEEAKEWILQNGLPED